MPRIYKGSETILKLLIDVPSTSVIDKIKIALFTTDRSIAMEFYADSITLYGNIAYLNAPEWTFMEMQDGIINYIAQGESDNKPFIFERQSNYILKSSDGFEMSEIMNGYYTKEETDVKLEAEQDKLVSGKTIKTINGESVLGAGNITIETDLTGYATEQYVNDAIANIDIPEGTGGATKYVIDLRSDDGYSMWKLDANMLLQEDKICYVRYVKFNTENGTESFQSILNGGRYETSSEFKPYVWSIIDDKLFTWDFTDGSSYATPTITPIGGSTEGGDSGVYIIEDTVEIQYYKFTCPEGESWNRLETEYDYNESYEGSDRQTKNLETITAIKEGKCKAVVFRKYLGAMEELVSSENGIETYVSKAFYSYFPCQFYLNPNSWDWGTENAVEFQYLDMGWAGASQDETTISKVFSTDTASLIAERAFSLLPQIQHTAQVSEFDKYKLYGWDFPIFRNSNTIMRIMMYKANWETGEETYEFYPASHSYNNHTNEVSVWIITKYGEIMMWNKPADVPDDTEIFPTVTSIGGGDSYTKEEIDSMIGDINNILTSI